MTPNAPKRWLLAPILAALAAAVACSKPEAQPAEDKAPPAVQVGPEDMMRVERERIQTGPRVSGSLEAKLQSLVRAEVGGSVLEVSAEIGEEVEAGQILARIESRTLREAVSSAQAAARSATQSLSLQKRELERTEALVKGGALAERNLDTARSSLVAAEAQADEARARLATARTQLADATIRAPIAGVVAKRSVSQGDVVAPGAELFTIIDPSSMRLEASVPSEALGLLEVGTSVGFAVRGYPGQEFVGTIERIAPAADEVTRQIPILVEIPNPGGKLVAGLFAEGRVAAAEREALVVPVDAVDLSGTKPTVTTVRDGVAAKVEVTLGLRDERAETVAVTAGLQEGDVVLLHGARNVAAGTKVILPGDEPAGDAAATAEAAQPAEAQPTEAAKPAEPAAAAAETAEPPTAPASPDEP